MQRIEKRPLLIVCLLLVNMSLPLSPLRAEEPDKAAILAQLQQIQQQMRELQQRIDKLASQLERNGTVSAPVANTPSTFDCSPATNAVTMNNPLQALADIKAQWRDLRAGMTSTDVEQSLGTPVRKFTLGNKTVWYYTYPGIGNGSVLFNPDGQVGGWQDPPFGMW